MKTFKFEEFYTFEKYFSELLCFAALPLLTSLRAVSHHTVVIRTRAEEQLGVHSKVIAQL